MSDSIEKWRDLVGNKNIKSIIINSIDRGALPSFILFTGNSGVGKSSFAKITSKTILCKNRDKKTGEPCGVCEECIALENGTSVSYNKINMPNLFKKSDISDTIKEIFKVQKISEKTVYVLEELHGISKDLQAQLLEELTKIPKDVCIISCTTRPYDLLPEISNRAVQFRLQDPTQKECEQLVYRLANEYDIDLVADNIVRELVDLLKCNPRLIKQTIKVIATDNKLTEESLKQFFNVIDPEYISKYLEMLIFERDLFKSICIIQELQDELSLASLNRQALEGVYDYVLCTSGGVALTESTISNKLGDALYKSLKTVDKDSLVTIISVMGQLSLRDEEQKSSQKSKIIAAKQKIEKLFKKQEQPLVSQSVHKQTDVDNQLSESVQKLVKDTNKQIYSSLDLERILVEEGFNGDSTTHEFRNMD